MRAIAQRQAELESLHGRIEKVVERRTGELRESEARFRLLAENSTDIIARQTPEGAYLYISPACRPLLGYEPGEVIGHRVDEFVHHDDRPRVEASHAAILGGTGPRTILYRIRHKDGCYTWFETIARAVRDPKASRGLEIHGASRDVTERVRIEEALRRVRDELEERVRERTGELERVNAELESQARELSRSNAELQQFAYVASHDLQEPLRMVSSYTQLLERRYKGRLDVDADDFIAYVVEGVARMQRLISDLLAYSRVGTRVKTPAPTPGDAALERAIANLRIALEESGATVTHDPLPTILVDEGQLVQLFQNLIGNAIKYRGEGPPRVHVGARRDGVEWHFAVRDNGIGIDPQYAERIFEIFQRLHTRDEYPGTGIGLAICKKIVERHSGRIWVESRSGMGATFHFTIPERAGRNGDDKEGGRRG
jgi:PAS domain S-box-containing protein